MKKRIIYIIASFVLTLFIRKIIAQETHVRFGIQFTILSGFPDVAGISVQYETKNRIIYEVGYTPFPVSFYGRIGYSIYQNSFISKNNNLKSNSVSIMIGYRYLNIPDDIIGFEGHFLNLYGAYKPTHWFNDSFGLTGQFGAGYLLGKAENTAHEIKIHHKPDLKISIGPSWK
ncbi:MAG: hypothetical protein ACLGGV_01235 [Bacteroidia bacterium]